MTNPTINIKKTITYYLLGNTSVKNGNEKVSTKQNRFTKSKLFCIKIVLIGIERNTTLFNFVLSPSYFRIL